MRKVRQGVLFPNIDALRLGQPSCSRVDLPFELISNMMGRVGVSHVGLAAKSDGGIRGLPTHLKSQSHCLRVPPWMNSIVTIHYNKYQIK